MPQHIKSALIGILAGICVYAGARALSRPAAEVGTDIGTLAPEVTESASGLALGAKQVTGGAKNSGTKFGTSVTPSGTLAPTLTPVPTPRASVTPWPSGTFATPSKTPTPTAVPTATATPTPTNTPTPTAVPTDTATPTPSPESVAAGSVVINEVAWAGTVATQYGEWIELYNASAESIDLSGWSIYKGDAVLVTLSGAIAAGDYFLIERSTDSSPDPITDIVGDITAKFGGSGLRNTGELLKLQQGTTVLDLLDCASGWPAGDATARASMERGADGAWHTGGAVQMGQDADGNPVNGTPRHANSQ